MILRTLAQGRRLDGPVAEAADSNTASSIDSCFTVDEIANTITHGIGFLLSLAALLFFWNATHPHAVGLRTTCVLFTLSMATVYLFSTLSHAVMEPCMRSRMRAWDQGTIYLLIAGTYSPFIWQGSPAGWTGAIMSMVWVSALWGFYLKVFARYNVEASSTVTYVLLGWIPAFLLIARTPAVCFLWMILGGLSYTLGILFLIRSHHAWFTHSVWHIMVMLGSVCHCIAVYQLLNYAGAS